MEFAPLLVAGGIVLLIVVTLIKTAKVVPQRSACVVERLGKYARTLDAGFHLLIPFIERVAYRHSMKEIAVDVPSQTCITKDNIAVEIDGVLYMQVLDAKSASYGIEDYRYASIQLAQTTLRSEIGKLELDRTFEEREMINAHIIDAVDRASEPWGLKITRYEISNINPPQSVKDALEKQMRAERERRAVVARSEGERQAKINMAEGYKQHAIMLSEAKQQQQINEAQGKAQEIALLAQATAEGIRRVAGALQTPGGQEAMNLRIAEQCVNQFGNLAKATNTMILPANLSDLGGTVAALTRVIETQRTAPKAQDNPSTAPDKPSSAQDDRPYDQGERRHDSAERPLEIPPIPPIPAVSPSELSSGHDQNNF